MIVFTGSVEPEIETCYACFENGAGWGLCPRHAAEAQAGLAAERDAQAALRGAAMSGRVQKLGFVRSDRPSRSAHTLLLAEWVSLFIR
jgi:hypothetical protein